MRIVGTLKSTRASSACSSEGASRRLYRWRRGSRRGSRNRRIASIRKPPGSRVIRTLTVIALALLWAGTSLASVPESAARPGRLPTGIVPVHYDIHVEPDAAALTTRGTVSIDVVVERRLRHGRPQCPGPRDPQRTGGRGQPGDRASRCVRTDGHVEVCEVACGGPASPAPRVLRKDRADRVGPVCGRLPGGGRRAADADDTVRSRRTRGASRRCGTSHRPRPRSRSKS